MPRSVAIDMMGQRFGRLVVTGRHSTTANGQAKWHAQCDCGSTRVVFGGALRRGNTRSCGCLNIELTVQANTTHGLTKSPEYRAWRGMISRCTNRKLAGWKNYGGRGITVCSRWRGEFMAFLADMGPRPTPKHSIDRKDGSGDYTPDNCRWATAVQQGRNRRSVRVFDINDERIGVRAVAHILAMPAASLRLCLRRAGVTD